MGTCTALPQYLAWKVPSLDPSIRHLNIRDRFGQTGFQDERPQRVSSKYRRLMLAIKVASPSVSETCLFSLSIHKSWSRILPQIASFLQTSFTDLLANFQQQLQVLLSEKFGTVSVWFTPFSSSRAPDFLSSGKCTSFLRSTTVFLSGILLSWSGRMGTFSMRSVIL